jgi:hypothetical protein
MPFPPSSPGNLDFNIQQVGFGLRMVRDPSFHLRFADDVFATKTRLNKNPLPPRFR